MTSPTPPPPEAESKATFHDPALTMVGSSEGGGLFSWFIDLATDGLREGATVWIADNTSGRLLNYLFSKLTDNGTDEALGEINKDLVEIKVQLKDINRSINDLSNQLTITKVDLENYIANDNVGTYIQTINDAYGYCSDNTVTDDLPNGSNACNPQANFISLLGLSLIKGTISKPDGTISADDANYLKQSIQEFYTRAAVNAGGVKDAVSGLHTEMVPVTQDGVLRLYANKLLLNIPPATLANPDNAMKVYLLLEAYFAKLLQYQTRGLNVMFEAYNSQNVSGAAARTYLDTDYKHFIVEEVMEFQRTVNYLMVNMFDYRNKENLKADANYLNQGLARDDLYLQVYARSRVFSAQLLKSFNHNGYTLHGAIIIPSDYAPGSAAVDAVTLKFNGPNNTSFMKTVHATPIPGRFPYTKWSANGTSSPDNHWSFYDFDFTDSTADLPAGEYTITLISDKNDPDNDNPNLPWFHTSTSLGKVSIKYYDPETFNPATATPAPTPKNTVKFGAFSGRWNWGYCRLASSGMSLWKVPEKTATRGKDNPELFGNTQYYPHKSAAGPINNLSLSFENVSYTGIKYTEYTINLPFKVGGAPNDTTTKASAHIYYLQNGSVMLNNPNDAEANVRYKLLDLNSKTHSTISSQNTSNWRNIAPYTNAFVYVNESLPDKYGASTGITLNPSHGYELSVDAELAYTSGPYWSSYAIGYGSLGAYWMMQVVYTNKYDIF